MSREKINSLRCDRCGKIERYREGDPSAGMWILAFVATDGGREIVGTHDTAADLCPECGEALRQWVIAGPSEAPDKPS